MSKIDKKINYPRPQFYRKGWIDLNGEWDFTYDENDLGEKEKWYSDFNRSNFDKKIDVPYVYQSPLSGVGDNKQHNIVWYKRVFLLEKIDLKTFINFEASDYSTSLWVNGNLIGRHKGGFSPFTFEITDYVVKGENTITVKVEDNNLCTQPIGKQSWKESNFLCWYTRTVGIWLPVWIEQTQSAYIKEFKLTPNLTNSHLDIDLYTDGVLKEGYLEAKVTYKGEFIRRMGVSIKNNRAKLSIDVSSESPDFRLHYWTPETPDLYDIEFTLRIGNDVLDIVDSYFGMRDIQVQDGRILLNYREFYQKLILDQGYYGDGLMTPTVKKMSEDLHKVKEMGFNGVRKHQKTEDRRYMYLCDKLGLVMWAEMPSPFEYSINTIENMIHETKAMIKKHWNSPSVICYTLMNESWGVNEIFENKEQQYFLNSLYSLAKAMDSSRLIIGNDGWEHTLTDVLSIHDYNSDSESLFMEWENKEKAVNGTPSLTSNRKNYAKGYNYNGEPVIISEYGGIAYSEKEIGMEWGYGDRPKSKNEVLERLKKLTEAIIKIDYLSGFCYTQLTDVEQEINGLLDSEHKYKFDPKEIKKILSIGKNNGYKFE